MSNFHNPQYSIQEYAALYTDKHMTNKQTSDPVLSSPAHTDNMKSFHLSMATFSDTHESDLDTVLGQLSNFENQLNTQLSFEKCSLKSSASDCNVGERPLHGDDETRGRRAQSTSVPAADENIYSAYTPARRECPADTQRPVSDISGYSSISWTTQGEQRAGAEEEEGVRGAARAPPGVSLQAARTSSPDADSAFSDSMSLLSSDSCAVTSLSPPCPALPAVMTVPPEAVATVGADCGVLPDSHTDSLLRFHEVVSENALQQRRQFTSLSVPTCHSSSTLTRNCHSYQFDTNVSKEEKIRLALDKIREANVRKLFVKVFCCDGSSRRLIVDETMRCAHVLQLMMSKHRVALATRSVSQSWVLVEHLPHLYMERVYEDHENLVENLLQWKMASQNTLRFEERPAHFQFFSRPELVVYNTTQLSNMVLDDQTRSSMLQDIFDNGTGCVSVPFIDSELWLKSCHKKVWKRHCFVLRSSGIFFRPKSKSKSKNFTCFCTFADIQAYRGVDWLKKFRSPTEYCLAIKEPGVQCTKTSKSIRYLCADDSITLWRWITAIRIAKFGRILYENHRARNSCHTQQVSEGTAPLTAVPAVFAQSDCCPQATMCADTLTRQASSDHTPLAHSVEYDAQNSGTLKSSGSVESASSTTVASSPACLAFDLDSPQGGTIRRKSSIVPSCGVPKLPLTSTTRSLVKSDDMAKSTATFDPSDDEDDDDVEGDRVVDEESGCCVDGQFVGQGSLDTASSLGSVDIPHEPSTTHVLSDQLTSEGRADVLHETIYSAAGQTASTAIRRSPSSAQALKYSAGTSRCHQVKFGSVEYIERTVPLPPKRSDTTRLSGCGSVLGSSADDTVTYSRQQQQSHSLQRCRSAGSDNCTDESDVSALTHHSDEQGFLRNLQRVMARKWSVAEKCKIDLQSPHEVLGFREPLDPTDRQSCARDSVPALRSRPHVDKWLEQHYPSHGAPPTPHAPCYDVPRNNRAKPVPPPRDERTQLTLGRLLQ